MKSLMFMGSMLMMLFVSACSDDPATPVDTRYQAEHESQVMKSVQQFLGKGYKGYQYYANHESCTLPLFDLSDLEVVEIQDGTHYQGRFASGNDKYEFYDAFSAKVTAAGTYEGFSGEIMAAFDEKTLNSRDNSFATSHASHSYYRLTVSDKAPLLDNVAQDLMTLDPVELFDRYGTHYLRSIYIGGRVTFSSYMNRTQVTKGLQVDAAVKASYLQLVEGSTSASSVADSDIAHIALHKKVDVFGGDTALASQIMNGVGEPAESYAAWAATVPDYMAIADFADDGLVAIYMLVEDEARRNVLKTAWTAYMADKTSDVLDGEPEPVVTRNAKFTLLSEEGSYFGKAPFKKGYVYYYPKMANAGQTLLFTGNGDPLLSGHNVKIKTAETFKDTVTHKWSKRVYLGAFGNKTDLYYWKQTDFYNDNLTWIIEKVDMSIDNVIRSGDKIRIKNKHFDKKTYLAPSKDGFTTTIKTPHTWTITLK